VPAATFYFDVGSPYAYLAAERADRVLPGEVRWQPVLLGGLFKLTGRSSWALGDYRRRQTGMAEIERRARGYGLPPIVWPDPWPADYLRAMRVVTWGFQLGAGHELARQLFRAAFVRGHDLSIEAHVLAASSEAGLDRHAALAAMRDPEIKRALREATEAAHALGVFGVPTVAVGGELFWGDDRLENAAAHADSVGRAA
jgi:2-hydroxychromene-2-carboxylate isomerase